MASKYYQSHHTLSREFFCGKLFDLSFFRKIPCFIYKTSQGLIWLPSRLIFSFFLGFQVENKENIDKFKGPLIVAVNHSSWIDPFLVSGAFPFWADISPIRYGCWHKYYYKFRNYPFLRLLGSFPVKKKIGIENSLKAALEILKNKGVVGIFPEGKRFHRGRHRKGRRGAAYLAFKTKTKILPVKIEEPPNMNFWGFILRRYKIRVKIGEPLCLHCLRSYKSSDLEGLSQATELIMQKIWEL